MNQETTPTPLSQRCRALLSEGLHLTLTSERDGFSLTYQEAYNLKEAEEKHGMATYQIGDTVRVVNPNYPAVSGLKGASHRTFHATAKAYPGGGIPRGR